MVPPPKHQSVFPVPAPVSRLWVKCCSEQTSVLAGKIAQQRPVLDLTAGNFSRSDHHVGSIAGLEQVPKVLGTLREVRVQKVGMITSDRTSMPPNAH